MRKACPENLDEMIKINKLKRAIRVRADNLMRVSNNDEGSNSFYCAANTRSLFDGQWLEQLHKSVSDANQHNMSNNHFFSTRFTIAQIQVLFNISEKHFN